MAESRLSTSANDHRLTSCVNSTVVLILIRTTLLVLFNYNQTTLMHLILYVICTTGEHKCTTETVPERRFRRTTGYGRQGALLSSLLQPSVIEQCVVINAWCARVKLIFLTGNSWCSFPLVNRSTNTRLKNIRNRSTIGIRKRGASAQWQLLQWL